MVPYSQSLTERTGGVDGSKGRTCPQHMLQCRMEVTPQMFPDARVEHDPSHPKLDAHYCNCLVATVAIKIYNL